MRPGVCGSYCPSACSDYSQLRIGICCFIYQQGYVAGIYPQRFLGRECWFTAILGFRFVRTCCHCCDSELEEEGRAYFLRLLDHSGKRGNVSSYAGYSCQSLREACCSSGGWAWTQSTAGESWNGNPPAYASDWVCCLYDSFRFCHSCPYQW